MLPTVPREAGAVPLESASPGVGAGFLVFSTSPIAGGDEQSLFPMTGFSLSGMPAAAFVQALEQIVDRPIVDETGLPHIPDLQLRATIADQESFVRALRDEAGLILTPARREVPALVVRQR